MSDPISSHFHKSLAALARAADDAALLGAIAAVAQAASRVLATGGKLLLVGNGGSAADAQHIAAEIVGRYKRERAGWAALALTTDSSALTAISNDYGFEAVFARQVEGLGRPGDMLWALSTSGRSPNIHAALNAARSLGITTVGFTGLRGRDPLGECDHLIVAPSDDTPCIQQIHLTAAHAICDHIEQALTAPRASGG
jgi:D-sedoheptulose 7-phosphate isomerase